MLIGEPGSGKTDLVQEYVRSGVCELGKADTDSVLNVHADR